MSSPQYNFETIWYESTHSFRICIFNIFLPLIHILHIRHEFSTYVWYLIFLKPHHKYVAGI
jgi:hypothetical protein